ncbi:hypothetical protein [Halarcobacter ebronensis]|uniref:Uncharacterized protein n=1 Tax=Halarcobacter ebronensis TaxID=1462615 RepID=A0A4Q1AQ96_9BACT|nr:hypothetical protein [Halarcobacter ebronensis]QKF81528.1 hypothetical protein AEBR_1031 [Halarcobacter ebronensis]RXK05458.1 hypothetical protein CRV07_08065 [Halarcobacter ebronensis]
MIKKITLFLVVSLTLSFAAENQKGKIDMHGGKGDSLVGNKNFSNQIGLSLKDKKIQAKDDKKFIQIEKIEKIEKKEKTKND